jgi:hypothetical protein
VGLLAFEIDGHLVDQKVDRFDLAEAPAFVNAIGAGLKLFEGAGCGRRELAGFHGALDFGIHWGDDLREQTKEGQGIFSGAAEGSVRGIVLGAC